MKGCGVAILLFLGAAIVLGFLGSSTPQGDDPVMVCVKAERFVKAKLKSPSTAIFESCADIQPVKTDDGWWSVSGYVDAQNGFGAMIRTRWVAEVKYESDWVSRSVGFSEQSQK